MNNRPRLEVSSLAILLVWTASVFTIPAFSQQRDDEPTVQRDEDEPAEEDEADDEEFSPQRELRELRERLEELAEEADTSNHRRELTAAAKKQLEAGIARLKAIALLEQRLRKAESVSDENAIERLEERIEIAIEQFERQQHLGDAQLELRELEFELKEAVREQDQTASKTLPSIISHQKTLLELIKRQHMIYDEGPEALEEPLEIGVETHERLAFPAEDASRTEVGSS